MGGGASSVQGVESLLATTMMIGRAIAAVTFPGMFRIYDFHSKKAPKIKGNYNSFVIFGYVSDDEEDDEPVDPSEYQHLFNVQVGENRIYLDDPLAANDAGWTPLHACCMSTTTVVAAMKLIEETKLKGGNLDSRTIAGPGTFNRDWTPLHMACAYGIEPIVERLIAEGADVNTMNSFGFTPLFEACHRGYVGIVSLLLKSRRLNLNYIPSLEKAQESPFVSSPPQSALGEAARSGFQTIVQMLIDAGANKDQQNTLGWTPLHEASFYNRMEATKILLVSGANPCIRTKIGALPYQLAGFQVLKSMIVDIGGPDAMPQEGENIDMLTILKEMSMIADSPSDSPVASNAAMVVQLPAKLTDEASAPSSSSSPKVKPQSGRSPSANSAKISPKDFKLPSTSEYLHVGPTLGVLPSLGQHTISSPKIAKSPTGRPFDNELDSLLDNRSDRFFQQNTTKSKKLNPSRQADDKKPKKHSVEIASGDTVPADTPTPYLCQLTRRLMSEPVKSIYGHVYEKSAITQWLSQQGRICPLTGAPLSDTNLSPMNDLAEEIREWILRKSLVDTSNIATSGDSKSSGELPKKTTVSETARASVDDLYDF